MSSTLFKTEYTMREDKFQKMARREKSLRAKTSTALRSMVKSKNLVDMKKHKFTKAQMVYLLMENQFSEFSMRIYSNIKDERSAPKRP